MVDVMTPGWALGVVGFLLHSEPLGIAATELVVRPGQDNILSLRMHQVPGVGLGVLRGLKEETHTPRREFVY